jgi:oxygen-independent coproporphyrinogen-3 oxidase
VNPFVAMSLSLILERAKQFIVENGLDSLPVWLRRDPEQFEIIYNYPLANDMRVLPLNSGLPSFKRANPTGVYVHVPFCAGTCSYCHYTRTELRSLPQIDSFLNSLLMEMALWSQVLPEGFGKQIQTVFIGGGTPTAMSSHQIERLAKGLIQIFGIRDVSCLREYTWEASPETLVDSRVEKLHVLRGLGVNRLSMGVQSFEPRLIELCGRKHTAEQAEEAYQLAGNAGFSNINMDFIYGLPTQTLQDWANTLETIARVRPQSVSIHQLRVKSGTRIYDMSRRHLPSDDVRITMLAMAHVVLRDSGYIAIENDAFVLAPEYDHQHQKDKWVRFNDLLGVGPAAYGYLDDTTYFNHLDEPGYRLAIDGKRLPIWRAKRLTLTERKARALVMGLAFYDGVSKQLYESLFQETVDVTFGPLISLLQSERLIETVGDSIRLTMKGGFFSPEVRRRFFLSKNSGADCPSGSYFRDFAFVKG